VTLGAVTMLSVGLASLSRAAIIHVESSGAAECGGDPKKMVDDLFIKSLNQPTLPNTALAANHRKLVECFEKLP